MCPPPETRTAMSGMRHSLSTAMAELKVFLLSLAPRPYDVPCAHIMKSDYVCNECPKTQGNMATQVLLAQSVAVQLI
jgi:hypothetical protein